MTLDFDPAIVVKHVIQLSGGHEALAERQNLEFAEIQNIWKQDSSSIGRILRAHLFTEHFLNALLKGGTPGISSLDKAKFTFAQKVYLLGSIAPEFEDILPGIRQLNKVRNRIAHSLHAEFSSEDADVLLGCTVFRALREAAETELASPKSTEIIDIIEDFAKHFGYRAQAHLGGAAKVWAEAYRLAQDEVSQSK